MSKIAGPSILFLRAFPPHGHAGASGKGERKSDRQAALDADTREVQKKAGRDKRRLRLGHSDERSRRRNESERDEREKARSLRAAESEERRRKSLLEMQQQQASPPPPPPIT